MMDIVTRDMAEQIGKMPTLRCTSGQEVSERQKKFAYKRTKIFYGYAQQSDLKIAMVDAADWFLFYGMLPMMIEPDFDDKMPRIRFENPMNSYPEFDIMGHCISYTKVYQESAGDLAAKYPQYANAILGGNDPRNQRRNQETMLSLVKYCDESQYMLYIPERSNLKIAWMANDLGHCPVVIAKRSQFDEEIRGSMDDVMWIQLAKSRLAMLNMEAIEKAIQGPLAIPKDVRKLPYGPDAVIQTDSPDKIRKVGLEFPPVAMQQMMNYTEDIMQGSRYPGSRAGKAPGSIVTGQGVEALEGGFDSQVMAAQAKIGYALQKALSLCARMDEKFWPKTKKNIRVMVDSTVYEETYTPEKDLGGNYQVDVTHGFGSGMDINRAAVLLLQLRGDKDIDRAFLLEQLPFDLDVAQMLQRKDVEILEDAALQAVASAAQGVGPMMLQGQDPSQVLQNIVKTSQLRQKGMSMTEAIAQAFKPPPAPPGQEQGQPGADQGPPGMGGPPGAPPGPGGPPGAPPGGGGGGANLIQLLAGLKSGGANQAGPPNPQMGATVKAQIPQAGP